jgi:hypothetical protein
MNTQTEKQTKKNLIKINEMEVGDVFSEESHYVYLGNKNAGLDNNGNIVTNYQFRHLESNQVVNLDSKYVSELLTTADQYSEEVSVGREDKLWTQKQIDEAKNKGQLEADSTVREGDIKLKGIRNLWADIHTTRVFSVCFDKKGKELTKKAFNTAKEKQIQEALTNISSGKVTLEEAFKQIQENPVLSIEKGDERILRGYKVQFSSTNGFYDVIDMDIIDDGRGSNVRKVNINEIKWLVVDGIRYVVE